MSAISSLDTSLARSAGISEIFCLLRSSISLMGNVRTMASLPLIVRFWGSSLMMIPVWVVPSCSTMVQDS